MAFAFDNINALLEDQQQKANIFGEQPGAAQQGQPEQGQVRTEFAAPASSGGVSSGEQIAPPIQPGQKVSQSQIISRNIGKMKAPEELSNIGSGIKESQQKYQEESQKYLDAAAKAGKSAGSVSQYDIDRAIAGDAEAQAIVGSKLKGGAGVLDTFKTSVEPAKYQKKIETYKDPYSMQAALQQQGLGGQEYTGREAALDAALLRRSPEFKNIMNQLGIDIAGLDKAVGTQKDISAKGQEIADRERAAGLSSARGYLGQAAERIKGDITKGTQAAKDRAAAVDKSKYVNQDALNAAISRVAAEFPGLVVGDRYRVPEKALALARNQRTPGLPGKPSTFSPGDTISDQKEYENYVRQVAAGMDPTGYVNVPGVSGDIVTSEQAQLFNNIMQLLGSGGSLQTNYGESSGPAFDEIAYANALRDALGLKKETPSMTSTKSKSYEGLPSPGQRDKEVRDMISDFNEQRGMEYGRAGDQVAEQIGIDTGGKGKEYGGVIGRQSGRVGDLGPTKKRKIKGYSL